MKTQLKRLIVISFCLITTCFVNAQIKLSQIIRDSMVLQRDAKINIWGWASKGEKVTVKFNGKTYHTKTND
jgi:sialate O-acetylesterase